MGSDRLPQLALALMLVVATCVAGGGAWLARRVELVRMPRDHAALHELAPAVEKQTRRLERLYESHLRRIGDGFREREIHASRAAVERIVGVRQLSALHPAGATDVDRHLTVMKPPSGQQWPEPTLHERPEGLPRPRAFLPQNELLGSKSSGWIDRPGDALYFWQRRDGTDATVVFTIDRAEVANAIDEWMRGWVANGAFAAVQTAGGPDRLLGASGQVLAGTEATPEQPERPDLLLPLPGRFGTWQLASWDPYETRTSYHTPTLVAAATLGLLTALLGGAVFIQQRRATAAAAQRVSFVNRVSHELRTPLTNILLNLDLATEALDDSFHEPARRLHLVHEEARRLGRLIDNVLTFSRQEQGGLVAVPRACVPASVITAVLEQFAPSFQRRGLEVRRIGELTTSCLLDADALAQILANLLSNVEKYVPGGMVEIAGRLAAGTLTLRVSDEGPGIPPDAAERIFRPFERLNQRVNEGASGTGLGLAIARDLAASMGGTLRLLPSLGGASFELLVPAPPAASLAAISAA